MRKTWPLGIPSARPQVPVAVREIPYRGIGHSVEAVKQAVLSPRGGWSTRVRLHAEAVVREVAPKDYLSELLALRYHALRVSPYLRDGKWTEWVRDPEALLDEIETYGVARCDCEETTAFLASLWGAVGNQVELVTVGFDRWAPHSHIFVRARLPGGGPHDWLVVDPVAGTKETSMLTRVVSWKAYSL